MPSFFTLPASEKKRKRADRASAPSSKRPRSAAAKEQDADAQKSKTPRRDESISGSESEVEDATMGSGGTDGESSGSEHEHETGAERRLRLAERYLENLKEETDETGFDAADLDRDLIAERLKEDVSESKGKVYRHIASDYDFPAAMAVQFRSSADCTTSVAVHFPNVYTAHKNMTLTKWELAWHNTGTPDGLVDADNLSRPARPRRRRPVRIKSTRGSHRSDANSSPQHHVAPILCLAVSPDGRFLATGGADKRLIIWSTEDLQPLRVFSQHRDAVLGLAFRRGTNQLYSGSADRTIKTWSLNELAYVETLFGHQDAVLDVAALAQERCLSAGARDRTVRLWKVVEETQLVFRGGDGGDRGGGKSRKSWSDDVNSFDAGGATGSIERVAFIDEETFISGSDNGTLSLWSLHKKKPVFSIKAAHGFDPPPTPEEYFAEMNMEGREVSSSPQARWITALAVVPYSDVVLSGSWDGYVRAWRVSTDRRKLELVGAVGMVQDGQESETGRDDGPGGNRTGSERESLPARGVVNDIAVLEHGDKGREILGVVAALGNVHRLGRWKKMQGRNGAVLFEISKKSGQITLPVPASENQGSA
ncbi:MAG: hypothetical protein LQ340_000054 [Diploschistes diacapsis]|nr:MAG: hypothetical protein LQ340_000054 [Diploschistes diacapsis]